MAHPTTVFYVYAETDEALRQQLEKHLALLQRQGVLASWQPVLAGAVWEQEREQRFNEASLILLLVSADFLASDVCYQEQMQRALERQKRGEVQVLPILVRPVDMTNAPFLHLPMVPTNGKPVTLWNNQDAAWAHITEGIWCVLEGKPLPVVQEQKEAARYAMENQVAQGPVMGEYNTIHQHYYLPASSPPPEVKRVWMVPYARNPFFTGRDEVVIALHQRFELGQVQAMSGLGGIGKTQIAVEYAHRYAQEYQVVLWVRANTRENLLSGYVALAHELELQEQDEQEQTVIVQSVKRWLATTPRRWLLILDNADELGVVRDFLPFHYEGHLLLTTRARAMGKVAQRFEVETMNEVQGALLVLRRARLMAEGDALEGAVPADVTIAKQITEELGGLPLALDQAGAYIEETSCSLGAYLKLYRAQRAELLNVRGGLAEEDDHPEAVATTWSLSFEKVQEQNPAAAALLQFCAFLAPEAIPEEILTNGVQYLGPALSPACKDSYQFNAMLKTVGAYSLLRRDGQQQMLSMHRLVQVVLRDSLAAEGRKLWTERAVQAVNATFPEVDFLHWSACERYLPQALICAHWVEQEQIVSLEAARLLHQTGNYLTERGQYSEAEPLYQRALAIREQQAGATHLTVATDLNKLAYLSVRQGKYKQAEPLYQRALAIREQQAGAAHPDTASSLNNLADLFVHQGKYKQAEQLYLRALAIREQYLGPEHPDTASSLNNFAWLYREQGKYEQAESLLKRALDIREQQWGLLHPGTLDTFNNLARLYVRWEKYDQAKPLYVQALSMRERQLGPEHPSTAFNLNNLAELYLMQEKYEQAEPLLKRALAIREQYLGPEHPDTASSLNNFAWLYREQGKYEQAESLLKRALAIREHHLGPEHPFTAQSLINLARLSMRQGKYEQAEPLWKRALAIREHHLEPGHPDTQRVRKNYASFLRTMGRNDEADVLESHQEMP